jgi:hypothetical protein
LGDFTLYLPPVANRHNSRRHRPNNALDAANYVSRYLHKANDFEMHEQRI